MLLCKWSPFFFKLFMLNSSSESYLARVIDLLSLDRKKIYNKQPWLHSLKTVNNSFGSCG